VERHCQHLTPETLQVQGEVVELDKSVVGTREAERISEISGVGDV
jgi:hypothetical protein